MEKHQNLIIIGTSHIAKQSLDEVKAAIDRHKPDIIALELDKKRYFALQQKKKPKVGISDIARIGITGYFFALMGAWAERKLGEYVGIAPGSEMIQAIKIAKKEKIKIALIDQYIEITLKKLSQKLTAREKWNFFADIFKAVFMKQKKIEFDLTKVPAQEIIEKMIKEVKIRYPNVYSVLIEDRNKIMAKNLNFLMKQEPEKKILAIMGAGHEKEIVKLLNTSSS